MVFGLKLGIAKKAPADNPLSIDSNGTTRSGHPKEKSGASKGGLTVNEFVARTKRCREKGLEPTKPELIAYARYLGIDPIADGDLMWIAEEALNAPLPAEWTEHHDNADRIFYYNVQSHQSSWTHPLEQLHRDTYKSIVRFRGGSLSKEEQSSELELLRKQCEDTERDTHKELQAWAEHIDEQGQKFYYNHDQQRSVWTDPRPARCHMLYLQMKALRVLAKHMGQSINIRGPEPLSSMDSSSRKSGHRHREGERDREHEWIKGHPLGGHHSNHTEGASGAGFGHEDLSGIDSEEDHSDARENKRKRKKRREGKNHSDSETTSHGMDSIGDPGGDVKKPVSLLDMKKSKGLDIVEEARSTLTGLGQLHHHHHHRGHHLPHLGEGRLPSPPGADALPQVGRAKVRAGIRLEPLEVE